MSFENSRASCDQTPLCQHQLAAVGLGLALNFERLDLFLKNIGINEKEFNEVVKSHAVYPADVNPELLEEAPELPDQKKWDKSSPMDRKYSSKKLKEHGLKDQIDN